MNIEALKEAHDLSLDGRDFAARQIILDVIANLEKEALSEPEQEPVAWMSPSWIDPDTRGWQDDSFESIPIEGWLPIYTQPPQRTWVGLTDEEKHYIRYSHMTSAEFIEFIEAKLKEKNNG